MNITRVIEPMETEDVYGYMPATVVKVAPNQGVIGVSFDEVFDEYSEARGDRRKRRQQRKLERVANKRELRRAKHEAKSERQEDRATRKKARLTNRQDRRSTRLEGRLGRNLTKVASRQERKGVRALGRAQRKELSSAYKEPELSEEEESTEEQGYAKESNAGELQEAPTKKGGGYEEETEANYSEETQSYPQDEERTEPSYSEEGGESYEEGGEEGGNEYEEEEDSYASGKSEIDPRIMAAAMKVEWHIHQIEKLKKQLENMTVRDGRGQMMRIAIMKQIGEHKNSAQNISSGLNGYIQSSADGRNTAQQVMAARRKARAARLNYKKRKMVTPVESELNPQISKNRIVVPPSSNADGKGSDVKVDVEQLKMHDNEVGLTERTGLIALDATNDEGAPETKIVDVTYSGADGSTTSNSKFLRNALIGVGVGILAIYAIKKYKLIK